MCGIFGSCNFKILDKESLFQLSHRGPDDFGEFFDESLQVYLGHRRLSIIDLSTAGRQPLSTENETHYITYNGEVYNFQNIKDKYLPNINFKSKTDTEVILQLYRETRYKTPEYLRGMFAFGVFDKIKREIFLCRDRVGIKPLYYYEKDGRFAFSSELSALKLLPGINLEMDPLGIDYYFNYGYIPAPFSAYKFIRKLKPGHNLVYDISNKCIKTIEPYWQLRDSIKPDLFSKEEDWLNAIEEKIQEAVNLRLISDVPLGAFLSGGLDSSLIVSTMAQLSKDPVKTFTIGFDFEEYDERMYAESVAKQYKTEHFVDIVRPNTLEILPELVKSFGEPFNDSSAIPTYYVSQMARKHVTVVLSGDGGDEVFAGYTRYKRMHRYMYLKGVPIQIRKIIQHFGRHLPKHLPGYGFLQRQGFDNLKLFQEMNCTFSSNDKDLLYSPEFKEKLVHEEKGFYERIIDEQNGFDSDIITQLQLIDLNSYLPEDILTKVDRMSMLHSLETRVPLLDHELIELAFSCPASIRFKRQNLKYIIKTILQDKVSKEVINHKKQGFAVPLSEWFRNDLKNFTKSLIDKTKSDNLINHDFADQTFKMHQKGGRDFSRNLYSLLIYSLWQDSH